jgi:acyl-CoA synthetase (AMP-forming)/AMP-acid ligase II
MGEGADLYERVAAAAVADPAATAIVGYDGRASSYAELLTAADSAAERLSARWEDGDVLGLAVDDPLAFVAHYLAAARLGMIAVLLDSRLSGPELASACAKYDVGRLAVDDPRDARADVTLRRAEDPDPGRRRAREGYDPDDFVVHLTSGSTGEPKGIVMSQAAIAARVRLWGGDLALASDDVVLCPLPLAHCHGIDVLTLPTLCAGGTVVFARGGRLTGRGFARQLEEHGVTVVSGLPLMYDMLTRAEGARPEALQTLRMVVSGSAPLPVTTQERFLERFGIPLRQVYGLSEIGVICFDRGCVGGGSIGLPISGIEWRLDPVDEQEDGGDLHELLVRGPALARGYYRDPAAEARMFEDGWLRTRDFIAAGADGWHVRGRQEGFINVAGNKVGPLEVEAALRECPGIVEGAVVGVPDPETTERVAALVVADDDFQLAAVRRALAERLLSHQVPQRFDVVHALPRTALGKVDYASVKRLVGEQEGTTL